MFFTNMQTLAGKYNGVRTWGFSQGSGQVYRHFRQYSKNGICAALVAHWIKAHAIDDEGLPAKLGLTPMEVGAGPLVYRDLNIRGLKEIAHDFVHNMRHGSNGGVVSWLFRNGMDDIPRLRVMEDISATAPNMEHDIVGQLKKFQACYANIGIRADLKTGHALAAWIGGYKEDACFFDPNYGEFWFRNKQDFFNFFPAFFRRAYNYKRSWSVDAWLPK